MTNLIAEHDSLRPLMFSIAYRMLGSVAEAEDVVQEAFLRMHKTDLEGTVVQRPEAFATTVTTRLAIDALRAARVRREEYVGPWLPEPVVGSVDTDPSHRIELDETVTTAFLVLLEQLAPVERAVFVLREVFDYGYPEIAAIIGKSEANCRQILVRSRQRIDADRPRFEPSPERRDELTRGFLAALAEGDVAAVERLLADDIVFVGDGGGKAPAIRTPMTGRTQVARFLVGLVRVGDRVGGRLELTEANGGPAARIVDRDGRLLGVLSIDIADGRVQALRNLINPDKLHHLGEVGDMNALLQDRPSAG
ncbi:MAG TPA: RNA polymerase sigma-70 factor [Jiangellaceae bacterium]